MEENNLDNIVKEDGVTVIKSASDSCNEDCAGNMKQNIEAGNGSHKESDTGSYLSGALGAFCGAALGGVVWSVILALVHAVYFIGLLIGWLAAKGYTLMKGKQGKGKYVIFFLAVLFSVMAGIVGSGVIRELPDVTLSDFWWELYYIFWDPAELLGFSILTILFTFFAALIGVPLLRHSNEEVSDSPDTELN